MQKMQRAVWFYRDYDVFSGGHLIHSHYFNNVALLPTYSARIVFSNRHLSSGCMEERKTLWPVTPDVEWMPRAEDILFIAGLDWQYALNKGVMKVMDIPRINLIQGVHHADVGTTLYSFLNEKAIRICVTQEVADAITETGRVNGPVLVIPNGVDLKSLVQERQIGRHVESQNSQVLIVGYKRPDFARKLAARLDSLDVEYESINDLIDRDSYFNKLDQYSIVVCCPHVEEGLYLPALEAMAFGCVVVTPDCIGNRSFCLDQKNCLVPEYTVESMVRGINHALRLTRQTRRSLALSAVNQAEVYSMDKERARFYEILQDVDQLW